MAVLDIMYICVNCGKPDVRPRTASGPILVSTEGLGTRLVLYQNAKNQRMLIEFILVLLSDEFIG